jgi:hypothetical protein
MDLQKQAIGTTIEPAAMLLVNVANAITILRDGQQAVDHLDG